MSFSFQVLPSKRILVENALGVYQDLKRVLTHQARFHNAFSVNGKRKTWRNDMIGHSFLEVLPFTDENIVRIFGVSRPYLYGKCSSF